VHSLDAARVGDEGVVLSWSPGFVDPSELVARHGAAVPLVLPSSKQDPVVDGPFWIVERSCWDLVLADRGVSVVAIADAGFGVTGFGEAEDVAVFGLDPSDVIGTVDVSQCGLESDFRVDAYTRSVVVESVEAGGATGSLTFVAHDL
jgi:hypothetical protein